MGNYQRNSYHSSFPNWRGNFNQEGSYIGIEFEVDSSNYRSVLEMLPDFQPDRRPITECDGSLGRNGVEIVFPPISLRTLKRVDCTFHQALAAIKDVVQHNVRTGMHMNVNTRGWSPTATALLCIIVNHMDDDHLKNLGGRWPTEYCIQNKNQAVEMYRAGRACHSVADNKDNRVELRFPMSTCDKARIDNLVDFIERLSSYAQKDPAGKLAKFAKETSRTPASGWSPAYVTMNYELLVQDFYKFLAGTKKGKAVLEALHTPSPDPDEIDSDDYEYDYDEDEDY